MSRSSEMRAMAEKHKLKVSDLAWEDMSRYRFSSVGSNITDTTLHAVAYGKRCSIIRGDNFVDHTADFGIDRFKIKVGNEAGNQLETQPPHGRSGNAVL